MGFNKLPYGVQENRKVLHIEGKLEDVLSHFVSRRMLELDDLEKRKQTEVQDKNEIICLLQTKHELSVAERKNVHCVGFYAM